MKNKFEVIDNIKEISILRLKSWCQEQKSTMIRSSSTYVRGNRTEKWFDKQWYLSKDVRVVDAPQSKYVDRLRREYYPKSHSCLMLCYQKGASILDHRDHTVSKAKVIQINIGCDVILTVDGQPNRIKDGDVVCFDSKLLHSVSPVVSERFVLSWREVKEEYLIASQQLSLFSAKDQIK